MSIFFFFFFVFFSRKFRLSGGRAAHQPAVFLLPAASLRSQRASGDAVLGLILDRHRRSTRQDLSGAADYTHHDNTGGYCMLCGYVGMLCLYRVEGVDCMCR